MNSTQQQIHDTIDAEIDRRHAEYSKPREPFGFSAMNIKRWYRKGSAGIALGWFDEIAEAHPDATPDELARLLAEKCEQELEAKPHYYTKRHLFGVVGLVRDAAQ